MKNDWVAQLGDRIEQQVNRTKGEQATIICESGISPSGPIHLGNLREIMTVHLVADELRSRGRQVEHIHIWDDYDRLRKIPAGVSPEFEQYIGCPLSDVPDPFGEYSSYAERYMTAFMQGMEQLQIFPRYIRQSVAYRQGAYLEQVKMAMEQRGEIFDILAEFQTLPGQKETVAERRAAFSPFRVYCEHCHKDSTQVTHYEPTNAVVTYQCQFCQHRGAFSLNDKLEGKLVWKVDWPMRWGALRVDFEPAGADHSTPGSSFDVGKKIVKQIYGWPAPVYTGYAFVGMDGRSKISSSAGTTATVESALDILEPCTLRWLYARRTNTQAFNIDYGQGLLRLYDEWDGLLRQIKDGKANEVNRKAYERATRTAHGSVSCTPSPVSFSLLTSVIDVTQGHVEQVLRIVAQSVKAPTETVVRESLEPRLTCALTWVTHYLPEDERTHIQASFDANAYDRLSEEDRSGLQLLVENLDSAWTLTGLTELMYRIPKQVRGLPVDAPSNDELKQAQRSFFVAIYTLICGKDTGPRIPTLLLSLGKEKVRELLTPA